MSVRAQLDAQPDARLWDAEGYFLQSLADAADVGMVVLDANSVILLWNKWIEDTSHIPRSGAIGKRLDDLFESISPTRLPMAIEQALRSGLSSYLSPQFNGHLFPLYRMNTAREKGVKKIGPFMVPRTMSSTCSATLATAFKIKGPSYSITSACSTSAHCIGNASEAIQLGKQDVVFAGGGEELHWTLSVLFDAMGALSSKYNDTPTRASRAYDVDRDGFVISGGGGVLVMEELEHAKARGAKIYAELVGYGASSDGVDMVQPSGEGAVRCMRSALSGIEEPVDYINTHGTSTPVGDMRELEAINAVFSKRNQMPAISSTKSLTGHSQGATGVHEAIYTLLMMKENFVAASANIDNLDPEAGDLPIARERIDDAKINLALSNSFGFGGTNAVLAFRQFQA